MIWETLIDAAKNKAGEYAINIATKKSNWEYIQSFFKTKKNNFKIIVLGSSGVGKTQFIQSLHIDKPQNKVEKRTIDVVENEIKINEKGIILFDTAGQSEGNIQLDEFQKTTTDDSYIGIINVVAYGYHQYPDFNTETEVFDGDLVKKDYLKKQREIEIENIKNILPLLKFSKIDWIITLVNKADIWWKEKEEVYQYYENEETEYSKVFKNHFQQNYFRKNHLVLPYASIIEPFYDRPNAGLLGDTAKNKLQNHFLSELTRLIK